MILQQQQAFLGTTQCNSKMNHHPIMMDSSNNLSPAVMCHQQQQQQQQNIPMLSITKGFLTSQNEKVIGGKRNTEVLPKQCLTIKGISSSVLKMAHMRVSLMVDKNKDKPTLIQVLEDKKVCPLENSSISDQKVASEDEMSDENTVPSSPPVREDLDEYLHMRDEHQQQTEHNSDGLNDFDEICSSSNGSPPIVSNNNQMFPDQITEDTTVEHSMEFVKLCVKHSTHICGGFFFLRFELYLPNMGNITATDGGHFQTITKRGLMKRGEKIKRRDLKECCVASISPTVSVTHGHQLVKITVTNMPSNVDLNKVKITFGKHPVQHIYSAQNGCIVVETSECPEGSYDVSVSLDGGKTTLSSGGTSLKMTFVSFNSLKDLVLKGQSPIITTEKDSSNLDRKSPKSPKSPSKINKKKS
jgi:hypothetical protein